VCEIAEIAIGLLHEQRGTREGAATADTLRFKKRDAHAGVGEQVRADRACDATTDDDDIDL
jgi:hypothetical protein